LEQQDAKAGADAISAPVFLAEGSIGQVANNIGELTGAKGREAGGRSRLQEQFGHAHVLSRFCGQPTEERQPSQAQIEGLMALCKKLGVKFDIPATA